VSAAAAAAAAAATHALLPELQVYPHPTKKKTEMGGTN
jgi:hypothetical protein